MPRDDRGMESLPFALVLGSLLAASTIAIGVACLDRAQRLSEQQRAVDSFNLFVERVRVISAGGVGVAQIMELDLGDCSIVVDGELVLLMADGAVKLSDVVPLRILSDCGELRSGSYIMELERSAGGRYIIRVRRV